MGNPVVHFEVLGKDAGALSSFYSDLFGWKIGANVASADSPDYRMTETQAGSGVDGGIGASPEGYEGHVTFYIGVGDVAAKLDEIERRGGKKMMGPQPIPGGGEIAMFLDPEGHLIGLVHGPSA